MGYPSLGVWSFAYRSCKSKEVKASLGESPSASSNYSLANSGKSASSATKSNSSNHKMTILEKIIVLDRYNSIPNSNKWKLSTGKIVDDEMKKLAEVAVYEHPVHSMILDPNDHIWKQYFTVAELNEIRLYNAPQLPSIPSNLEEYLNSYDQKWMSAKELYSFAEDHKHDPIDEFDKKWVKESMIAASELFLENNKLDINNFSEADLLHNVWPFVYRICKSKEVKACLGERASVAVYLAMNENRSLEAKERRARKAIGSKLDVVFKIDFNEYGSCEVGKDNVTVADD